MGRYEPILFIGAIAGFWFLFHLTLLSYSFFAPDCGYYSELWLNETPTSISPYFAYLSSIFLFFIYALVKFLSKNNKNKVLWGIALVFPVVSLYGLHEFNDFMEFQDGNVPIVEYLDMNNLSSWKKLIFEQNRKGYDQNKEMLIQRGRYCEAMDYYKRT